MPSYRISITPNKRVAARFVGRVRRAIQRAFEEENKVSGLTQSEVARRIGVHRSVINRELNGKADMTLGRVAQFAWAMGRTVNFSLEKPQNIEGQNIVTKRRVETESTNGYIRKPVDNAVSASA